MTETTTGTYTCEITKEAGTLTLEQRIKRLVSKMALTGTNPNRYRIVDWGDSLYAWDPDLYELGGTECPDCLRQDGKHNSRCPKGTYE